MIIARALFSELGGAKPTFFPSPVFYTRVLNPQGGGSFPVRRAGSDEERESSLYPELISARGARQTPGGLRAPQSPHRKRTIRDEPLFFLPLHSFRFLL